LRHAALYHDRDVDIVWIESEDLEKEGGEAVLHTVNGIVVPGGFGYRGIEGKVLTGIVMLMLNTSSISWLKMQRQIIPSLMQQQEEGLIL
jgi:phosphoribosylformylglycinamidine (FGAM) synthase-like amidotransferase family enzyme